VLSLSASASENFHGNYAAFADVVYVRILLAAAGCEEQFLF